VTATSITLEGRAAAEARMIDTCTITRGGGAPGFDPETGDYTEAASSTIYSGICEFKINDALTSGTPEVGGAVATISRLVVKVPMAVDDVEVDDLVTCTASALDSDLVGRIYRVAGPFAKTFATARRLPVEETDL
jgi:hypothetical protein